MGKRTNHQAAGKSNKKAKVDPVLASVGDVVMQADHLPERCRAMLVDMLPFSLSIPSDQRHEVQTWAVNAVEETLSAHKSLLEAGIVTEDGKLVSLKSSEGDLASAVVEAQTALDAQKEVVQSAKVSLADATEAANTASTTLATAQTEQKAGEAKLSSTIEEKATSEESFKAHFQTPMEEGACLNFKGLQPLLKHVEMEASLLKALPCSCSKSKEDRGSFDEVVLKELEKALSARIAALGDIVAVETPASVEREATVQAAEKDHTEKKEAQKQAADAFEAAQTEQSAREAALATARQAVKDFQPQVDEVTGLLETAKATLVKFETGPLSSFTKYKAQVAVSDEAAPAGA
jgi:hypothetical protein